MRIAGSRPRALMAEECTDQVQREPAGSPDRCVRVSQVMDAQIGEPSLRPCSLPLLGELDVKSALVAATVGEDALSLLASGQLREELQRRRAEHDGAGPRLRIGEAQEAALEVHFLPREPEHFTASAPGKAEEAKCVSADRTAGPLALKLGDGGAEPRELGLRKEAFAPTFGVALH